MDHSKIMLQKLDELEALAKAGLGKPHDAAIIDLIRDNKSRRNMLDIVINSVAAALERAGVTSVDDPGEAIDVLVADKDAEIAQLREALERIADYKGGPRSPHISLEHCRQTARAALAKAGDNDGR